MASTWLNYHHLYYFRVIAHEGGIAKASRKLRLGQPTLSTQLKQLEEALGHKLFERQQRQLMLTEAGRAALEYADEIFRLGDEMVEALNDRPVQGRVDVVIGAMDTVPKHLVLRLMQYALESEDCTVSVVEGHGQELLRELKAHRVDLLVSSDPPRAGEGGELRARRIASMPVIICGAKRFAGLAKGFPASLAGQPFVMPTALSRLRADVDHALKLGGLKVDVVSEVQDASLQKLLGETGVGLIPIAEPAAAEQLANKTLVRIGRLAEVTEELWLIAGERRIQNPVAARLMKSFSL